MKTWFTSIKSKIATTLGIATLFITTISFAQEPFIPKYDAVKRSERCFSITLDQNNQFGAVWFKNRGDFSQDTTLYFVVYMGDKDDNGADGLAFVMHDDPRDTIVDPSETVDIGGGGTFDLEAATGDDGGGLGYAMHQSRVNNNDIPGPHPDDEDNHRIWPSVAIEFDTWNNGDVQDGNAGNGLPTSPYYGWDHTSVVYNGDLYNEQQTIEDENGNTGRILPALPTSKWGNDANIEDNNCYAYKIDWKVNGDGTQTLDLYADNYNADLGEEDYDYTLAMTHTDDMINNVFGGETNLRFGFTGSTGGSRNEQTICLLGGNTRPTAMDDYATTSVNTPVEVDVESNDQDFDGDNLFVPIIVQAPANGSAQVITIGDENLIEYTPNATFTGTDTVKYKTCDVDSDKCYALCDTADAVISVGCGVIDIDASETSPYTLCVDTLPANGAAEATFVSSSMKGTHWQETFSNMNGATSDNGSTPWSMATNGGCDGGSVIEVQNNIFRAKKTGCEVVWETGDIDITNAYDIDLSIYLEAEGDMESDDYLEAYYILDGGSEVALTNGIHTDNFGNGLATASGLNADSTNSTLKIRIYARNSGGDENYRWDDVTVNALGAASPPNITYNWFDGLPGTIGVSQIGTGQAITGLEDTTYYVVGVDQTTGCSSDTVSVAITSDPEEIDSILIDNISPLTDCITPDGELAASVVDSTGTPTTAGYTFEWWENDFFLNGPAIRVGSNAANLEAKTYRVRVTSQSTGCQESKSDTVSNSQLNPTVSPSIVSHIFSCDDPTGTIAAIAELNGVQMTSDVTFNWYDGTSAPSGQPADYVGDTISSLPAGEYAVRAINDTTGCESSSANLEILDQRQLPNPVVTNATDQISCDPGAPTGSFTSAVNNGGGNTTANHTFNWYKGLNDVTPAHPGYTGGPDVNGLEADQYRLIVENDTTGCEAILDTAIIENITIPEIDNVNTTDVTICGPGPNGTITVTPVGDVNDFTYRVYSGSGVVPANLLVDTTANVIDSLDVGNYTVTIVDKVTQCESDAEFVSIGDATVTPTANFTLVPQISCDPGNPMGRIEAAVTSGSPNDYTFEWFVNSVGGTPVATTGGVNGEIAHSLTDDTYALRITNDATQCQNTYFQTISESITLPVIDTAFADPSTFCGTEANGQLHATADGGQTDPSIYTFNWTEASSGNFVSDLADVTDVAPDDYELVLVNDSTTCESDPYPVTVDDNTIIPNPVIDATNNSSCDVNNPNGSLEVTDVPNEAPFDPNDYSFTWYFDNSSGTQLVTPDVSFPNSPDSSLVTGLAGDDYAVVIYNKTTNCQNEVLSQITDINIKPVLDNPTITDATRCTDPYMSSVEVTTVNGGNPIPAGYSFSLENISTGDTYNEPSGVFEDLTDSDGIELPPGDYNLVAYNSFNCPSDTIVVTIDDNSTDPVFSLTTFDNTTCDVSMPNGIIEASTDGTYILNNIEWFVNNTSGGELEATIPSAVLTEDDTVATGLLANTYAVRVTADNGCESVEFASVSDIPANQPLIDSVYAENLTSCVIDNGEIGLSVDLVELLPPDLVDNRTYTFTIENTSTGTIRTLSTDPASSDPDTVAFVGLEAGDWEATVTDNYTNCVSAPITITIQEAPEIVFNVNIITKPSGCVANTGEMVITTETPGSNESPGGTGFDFSWYEGAGTSGPAVATVSSIDDWTSTADQLTAGYYTIEVTDRTSQCIEDTAVFLNRELPPIIDNVTATDATQCNPANGGLEITIDNSSFPVGRDYSDYDYLLFEGIVIDENWTSVSGTEYLMVDGASIGDPINGPVTFSSTIEAGTYIVVAREKFGANCFTDPEVIEIDLDFDLEINPTVTVSDSSCVGGTPTGVLDASFNDFGYGVTQVDYEWFSGTTTTPPSVFDPADGAPATISNRNSGTYTVQLEVTGGPGLGCLYDETINLPKIKPIQEINATITNNFNCAPFNGAVEVDDISVGGSNTNNSHFENFRIEDSDNTEISVPPNTATSWSGLAPGDYYISATKTTTQCPTKIKKVTVDDESEIPAIAITMDVQDYSCDDINPTGQLTAVATPLPGGPYDWSWTDSSGNPVADVTSPPDTSRIIDVKDDLYTVTVTDVDGDGVNDGCTFDRQFTLTQGNSPVITPFITATDQTICGLNGSIVVDEIEENRDNGDTFNETPAYSDYSATLFDDQLNVINTGANPWAAFQTSTGQFGSNQVPVGTYYVRAQNVTTGCDYGPPSQVRIKDVSKKPTVQISMVSPDYSCDPSATPTGELSTVAYGGTDNDATAGNFDYTWTDSGGFLVPNDGGTPPNAIQLREGKYTLEVEDISGVDQNCVTTRNFTVTHQLQEIVIVEATGTDQTWCDPNGTFQIDSLRITESGVTRTIGEGNSEFDNEYSFNLFEGDLNTAFSNPDGNTGFPSDPFTSVPENTYFAVAVNDGTLCESIPRQVIVDDVSEDPIVDISVDQPNYSLNYDNPNSLTGIMTVEAFESDGSTKGTQGYTYDWYRNDIDADSLVTNFTGDTNPHTVTNLRDAFYYLEVTSDSTSCTTTASQLLPFEYLKPYFNPDVIAQTTCVPPNGEINIPSISKVSDSTETFNKYRFSWYISEYVKSNPDSVKDGGLGGNMLRGLAGDAYYVQALDTFWMVESDPVKVVVADSTQDPVVNYNASVSKPQTSCNANTPNGVLSVTVTGFDTYDYAWYAGDTPSGNVLSATNTLTDLPAGTYTVSVTSQTTGCTTIKTYDVVDDIRIPIVAESTEPVTNCPPSLANGVASANVINVNSSYEFYWYQGTEVKNQADVVDASSSPGIIKTNSSLQNVQPGFYTVVAQDTFDCKSDPVTIEVKKEVIFPNITVEELAPLTYCDPEKPNAIFSARADGQKTGYTFEWFVKGDSLYTSGSDVNNLGNSEYLLVATNNVTGCASEMTVIPTESYLHVPNPLVDIIQHRKSCIEPDGIAEGDINAEIENYQFNYLDDENYEFLEKPQNYTTISELDINDYLVYAKDRISGCLSDTVIFTINDERYTPDFDVITTPSLCTDPTGEAEAVIGDLTKPFQIEWYNGFGDRLGSGRHLLYQDPGEYSVSVEGTEGCIGEQDFSIGTEIKIYNGVSANGDNLNDVFNIVCLEFFPDNNVKIFNRAGELVFEMHDYDRQDPDKNFDGFANRGPIKGSGKLAIGTYFYVVDKGDGTEPKVGYLELTR